MSVTEALRGRCSVRAFLPDPVPDEVIREVFDVARLAPSNSNTRPWHVSVVSGAARDEPEGTGDRWLRWFPLRSPQFRSALVARRERRQL